MLKFSICFIALISQVSSSILSNHHREKRFLIFPRGNPTRHQFVAGIGIPLDVEPESLIIGYVFKGQYFLPWNTSQLHPSRLERDIDNDYKDTSDAVRWSIYQVLDTFLRRQMKIDGKQCVLRAICEASQLPFTHESGLLGELLHIFLVPSTTGHGGEVKNDFEFAEVSGRSGENCGNVFSQCTFSLMGLLSVIHEYE